MKKETHKRTGKPSTSQAMEAAMRLQSKPQKSWFDRIPKEDQEWVLQVKDEYLSGSHPNLTASSVAFMIASELGIKLTPSAFRFWLLKFRK